MKNLIALRRKLIVVPGGAQENSQLAATLQAELMALGHMLDGRAFDAATRAPADWLIAYHDEVLPDLKKRLGADRDYQPIYRGFPAEVMSLSQLQLFLNAIGHYFSNGRWEPPPQLVDRGMRFENASFIPIQLANEDDLLRIFTRLAALPQSLGEVDKRALAWFADYYGKSLPLPAVIPFKETLCILAAKGLDVPVKSANDVLRIAVYMSGGDISLPAVPSPNPPANDWPSRWFEQNPQYAQSPWWSNWIENYRVSSAAARVAEREKFKFKRFSRPERYRLLTLLEKLDLDLAEMQLRLGRWLRLGEILHIGEHARKFPKTAKAFDCLRNQTKASRVRTFPGQLFLAFARSPDAGMKLLSSRPGEFARRLDWLIRTFSPDCAIEYFRKVAPGVSAKVLLELYTHFASRHLSDVPRTIMIKGQRSRMRSLIPHPPLPHDLVARVSDAILAACRSRIARLAPLGRVWIDPRLKDVPIPSAMRSVNTSVKTYVRGTRIPFRPDARVIRAFLHWFDEHGSEDLDLSVGLYTTEFNAAGHISFTNLKNDTLNCCHSGDIRHRQGSCAEYADIDITRCLERDIRYATVLAFNYNGRPMHTVKQCVFGLMEREHPQANEIFVPKTIANGIALGNESTSVIVCILDLQQRQYIWADVESEGFPTLESTTDMTSAVLRSLLLSPKLSVHDLLSLHVAARGSVAKASDSADLSWGWEDFVTDYSHIGLYMNF